MALDKKITELPPMLFLIASNDLIAIVDVSDLSMAASGTTKRVPLADFIAQLNLTVDTDGTTIGGDGSIGDKINSLLWARGAGSNSIIHKGSSATAVGSNAVSLGVNTQASGDFGSHAEGINTIASGSSSHAEGVNSEASGYAAHAEGATTIASGQQSHAEGNSAEATNDYAHAEGDNTLASGVSSHAEGVSTIASSFASHSEGILTQATGAYSHAGGDSCIASGPSSFIHSVSSTVAAVSGVILGGSGHSIDAASPSSAIIGGTNNTITNADRSVILGGQSRTETKDDYVNVPSLRVTVVGEHADNAAALAAGLTIGAVYKTTSGGSSILKIVS